MGARLRIIWMAIKIMTSLAVGSKRIKAFLDQLDRLNSRKKLCQLHQIGQLELVMRRRLPAPFHDHGLLE